MRYASRGYVSKDQNGQVLPGATVAVFLAGTTTPASIYAAATGGAAVNSITSDANTGYFQFFVDLADYKITQLFDIYISMAVFPNVAYVGAVLYNEVVFPGIPLTASKAWQPASLDDGDMAYTTITVTGAQVGDSVICGYLFAASGVVQNGFVISGFVSVANTVTVVIVNHSGGTVVLDSNTLNVGVFHI